MCTINIVEWMYPVKQATELHRKLEYVNKHQNCEIEQIQNKLTSCRQELIESRALKMAETCKETDCAHELTAKLKATEQDLKMVWKKKSFMFETDIIL